MQNLRIGRLAMSGKSGPGRPQLFLYFAEDAASTPSHSSAARPEGEEQQALRRRALEDEVRDAVRGVLVLPVPAPARMRSAALRIEAAASRCLAFSLPKISSVAAPMARDYRLILYILPAPLNEHPADEGEQLVLDELGRDLIQRIGAFRPAACAGALGLARFDPRRLVVVPRRDGERGAILVQRLHPGRQQPQRDRRLAYAARGTESEFLLGDAARWPRSSRSAAAALRAPAG